MKTLIANTYRKIRTRIDRDIDALVKGEGIVRYGDHYVYGKVMDAGSVAIDLGANRGHFSEQIASVFHPRIYLVEANLDLLQAINIPNAVKINAAITSSDLEMTFYVSRNPEASSLDRTMAAQYGIIEERRVECITFNGLLSRYDIHDIDLLKVDIEGAELDLLAGMTDMQLQKCKQIAIEFHDFMAPETLPEVKKIVGRLHRLGFTGLKFSTLDWRRVLFVQSKILSAAPSFYRRFRSMARRSRMLDYLYYRTLIPMVAFLKGKR